MLSLEPGWSPDSELYKTYKNSKVSDLEYKEIPTGGSFEKKYAFVIQDHIAIDAQGQVYRKGGCI
ncbi:MAG: hypothetical protein WC916_07775 [Candidatus Woesearchaeota archaeon]